MHDLWQAADELLSHQHMVWMSVDSGSDEHCAPQAEAEKYGWKMQSLVPSLSIVDCTDFRTNAVYKLAYDTIHTTSILRFFVRACSLQFFKVGAQLGQAC